MNPWVLTAAGAVVVCYAAVSRRLSTTVLSAPLVFMAVGLAIGPLGLDLTDLGTDLHPGKVLLESALSLLLFSDAAAIRGRELRRERFLPLRLLAIGLPLTIALGWLIAWPLLSGLGVWGLALVAVILAPTDAALGQQAVANRRVPALVRHGLSVESGLNDGLALPFFLLALAAAGGGHGGHQGVAETFYRALLLSGAIGAAAGWLGARLLRWSVARGWVAPGWRQLLVIAIPPIAYALSGEAQGSGFIAAWVAGLVFGNTLRAGPAGGDAASASDHDDRLGRTVELTELLGVLLAMLSFLFFGAVILGPTLQHLTWQMPVYALLSLTIVRLLPVAIALLGTGLRPPTVAYVGWFGPRGLASVVFGLIAFEYHLPGASLLSGVVAVTVGLSVCLHGASAAFLGSRYGAWYSGMQRSRPDLVERTHVAEEAVEAQRASRGVVELKHLGA